MSSSFKFIDHTADIAVEVNADSLTELFSISAAAFKSAVLEPESVINSTEKRKISLNERSLEELLVSFLCELNFLLQSDKWIFNNLGSIEVYREADWFLNAELLGEKFDPDKNDLKTEIKAVTFHQMDIKLINEKYTTRIVFDI